MRKLSHEDVLAELDRRGFNDEWVSSGEKKKVDQLNAGSNQNTRKVIDSLAVSGTVTDGFFEGVGPEYDFTRFFTENDGAMVGRLMYYGLSVAGTDYTFSDLVADIDGLAGTPHYDASFDRDTAFAAGPN